MPELFECEKGCGFEHTDIKIVENHETTCEFVIEDTPEMALCRQALESTMDHEQADPFNEPVNWKELGIPEYPKAYPAFF